MPTSIPERIANACSRTRIVRRLLPTDAIASARASATSGLVSNNKTNARMIPQAVRGQPPVRTRK